jgi:hypothetical protein
MSNEDDTRGRGFLTPTDREYLRGEIDYENQETDAHRRRDIRDRTKNSIRDFKLLFRELEEQEREKIFTDIDIRVEITFVLAFLCLGLENDSFEPKDLTTTSVEREFNFRNLEELVSSAVREVLLKGDYYSPNVYTDIQANAYSEKDLEVLKEILQVDEEFGPPSPDEVTMLMVADEIDPERLNEFIKKEVTVYDSGDGIDE